MEPDVAHMHTNPKASTNEGAAAAAAGGFLPVPLHKAPSSALCGLPIYLKASEAGGGGDGFVLYRTAAVPFTPEDRRKLLSNVRYIYIRRVDLTRFQVQAARSISAAATDSTRPLSERAALVYDRAIELMNELLAEPDVNAHGERLMGLARSAVALIVSNLKAFAYLFQAARHDCSLATHFVNVGLWMVPLAHALGHSDAGDLAHICQAGLLHDVGKIFVSPDILYSPEKLSPEQWARVARHSELGWEHLRTSRTVPGVVKHVCRQHHERMDGTGYPDGRRGIGIHPVARICAVIDSFDAMTAQRAHRPHAVSVSEAIMTLRSQTPAKYDPKVVSAWVQLLGNIGDQRTAATARDAQAPDGQNRRRFKRFRCDAGGTLRALIPMPGGSWQEEPEIAVRVFDVSRFGLAVLSAQPVQRGRRVRICLQLARPKGCQHRRVTGEVVRCLPREDGGYEIGIRLYPQAPVGPWRG